MEIWISQTEDWTQAGDSLIRFTLGGGEIPEEAVLHSMLFRATAFTSFTASTAQLENLVNSPVFPEISDTDLQGQLSRLAARERDLSEVMKEPSRYWKEDFSPYLLTRVEYADLFSAVRSDVFAISDSLRFSPKISSVTP